MKACPSYPGYSITEQGQVFTHRRRFGKGRYNGGGVVIDASYCKELKITEGHGGYLYASISTSRGQRSIPVHLLLLDAFIGPLLEGFETRHLDGNRKNNKLINLLYGTPTQNAADTVRHGSLKGENHPNCKINEGIVKIIRDMSSSGIRISQIMKDTGCSRDTINGVVARKTWKHVL